VEEVEVVVFVVAATTWRCSFGWKQEVWVVKAVVVVAGTVVAVIEDRLAVVGGCCCCHDCCHHFQKFQQIQQLDLVQTALQVMLFGSSSWIIDSTGTNHAKYVVDFAVLVWMMVSSVDLVNLMMPS
jgi:hypothetical protein